MRGARALQKDLFDEAPPVAELPLELRRNLTALLQMLLAEAADLASPQAIAATPSSGGVGDDQDHA